MDIIRELMNFNSFWTIWFWLLHVVAWSMASHFTLGVPFDMVIEANRENDEQGPYARATEALILAQVFRFNALFKRYGAVLVGFTAFLLAVLVTLGTLGGSEFARAVFTLMLPLTLIYVFTIRFAARIDRDGLRGAGLRKALGRQRLLNQLIGVLGISLAVILAVHQVVQNIESFLL
ncbi:MAG: hypothetical protein AAGE38_00565 [Pseudomonadota bacterium]